MRTRTKQVTYGILRQNLWIYFANCPGFILSVWLNLGAAKLQYQHHHVEHMRSSFVSFLQQRHQQENTAATAEAAERKSPSPSSLASSMSTVEMAVVTEDDVEACAEQSRRKVVDDENDDDNEEGTKFSVTKNNSTPAMKKTNEEGDEANAAPNVVAAALMNTAAADAITNAASTVTDWAKIVWDVTSETTPAPAPHERLVLFFVVVWVVVISIVGFATALSEETKQLIVGTVVNMNLVFFYGAPLSTIFTVVRQKDSASIHIPTMVMNTLNGTFWFVYGMAILDFFVAVPNGLGTLLGVIQIVLCVTFPRHNGHDSSSINNNTINNR